MDRRYDVMAAAHICLDLIPRFYGKGANSLGELLTPGKLVEIGPADISTGGSVSNTGIALCKLGNKVCFSTRIGDDAFGRLTVELLERGGHTEGVHVTPGDASSYTVLIAAPGIDRVILHHPGANDQYGAEDLDLDLLRECRLFHFGYPSLMRRMYEKEGAELRRVFELAKEAGATTSCDMALPDPDAEAGRAPWGKILEAVLPHVDIFLPSVEEAYYMVEPDAFLQRKRELRGADLIDCLTAADVGRIADQLLALGARMTSLKMGRRGIYFKTQQKAAFDKMGAAKPGDAENWSARELWCPAFQVPPVEGGTAAGAGDASIAGFLTAFLRGRSVEESLKSAACLGWQNLQAPDALSGIHTWEETVAFLEQDITPLDANIEDRRWAWSEPMKLWAGPADPLNGAQRRRNSDRGVTPEH